jgi:hypothetical protein
MVVAILGLPVKLTGVSAITKSKLVPRSSEAAPDFVAKGTSRPARASDGNPESPRKDAACRQALNKAPAGKLVRCSQSIVGFSMHYFLV